MQIITSISKVACMPRAGHFSLDDNDACQYWRDKKLSEYPVNAADLLVEIENPFELTGLEKKTLVERCRKTNMLIYPFKKPVNDPTDKTQLKKLGQQLGLCRLDNNLCADNDGITSL